jgi:hypothetical protein
MQRVPWFKISVALCLLINAVCVSVLWGPRRVNKIDDSSWIVGNAEVIRFIRHAARWRRFFTNVVVMLYVTLHQTPRIFQRQRRPGADALSFD